MLTERPCGTSEPETRALQPVAQRKPSMAPLAAEGGQHGNTLLRGSEPGPDGSSSDFWPCVLGDNKFLVF